MTKIFFIMFFYCASCTVHCAFAQAPLLKMWDYRYGGSDIEYLYAAQQTSDGGYILGGYSYSGIGGDKSQGNWGGGDYWIVKIDSLGIKQWDRDFGGTDWDYLYSVQQTADGGYILGGFSRSGVTGDKTQPTQGGSADIDYWIVKTDSLGIKQWDLDFGGMSGEVLTSLQQTNDRGYILGGFSYSGTGGDKTQASWGGYDYWIIKIDSLGNKQWDKDFGGIEDDFLYTVQQTFDNGYVLAGWSNSNMSGDKSQNVWGNSFDSDYWIVKTDSLGNKQWDKDFGGIYPDNAYLIKQTADKGYILGGWSDSNISGDKTEGNWDVSGNSPDYWILKIDSIGNKIWDRDFGGTVGEELIGNISFTADNGFLFSGTSYSDIGGDKTENNLGPEQSWILKTDSLGHKQWDKTLRTNSTTDDETCFSFPTRDGCYVMINWTAGGIGGDKSQPSRGYMDYWAIKFCEVLQANFTSSYLICPGTCVDFTNLSSQATSFQWSFPGASPNSSTDVNPANICYATPGNYDVQLIATNANGSDTLLFANYMTVYPQPSPQSITQSGDTLFAIAVQASFQWYYNGNIINGATDYFYIASASGDYNVVVTDVNGCEVEAAIFNVVASVDALGVDEILIFPNPVEDKVKIHPPRRTQVTRGTAVEISVYNVVGEMVLAVQLLTANCTLPTYTFDVSTLTPGLFYLELTTDSKTFRTKFVKQ